MVKVKIIPSPSASAARDNVMSNDFLDLGKHFVNCSVWQQNDSSPACLQRLDGDHP